MIEREPCFKWIIKRQLELIRHTVKNPIILDVGANYGDYVFLMHQAMNGEKYKMVAVEPNPAVFKILKSNVMNYGLDCDLLNLAITDITGEKTFYVAKKDNLGSVVYRPGVSREKIIVKSSTIEDLRYEQINFIKMDIEGGEVLALRGSRDYLKDQKNIKILLEIHPAQYTKELSLEEELEFLFNNGWRCRYMVSSAMPHFYSPYHGLNGTWETEVKPGWKRMIFVYPARQDIFYYGCQEVFGVPTWRGTVNKKLMRGLLLESKE